MDNYKHYIYHSAKFTKREKKFAVGTMRRPSVILRLYR